MNFAFRVYFSDMDRFKFSGVNVAMRINTLLFVFSESAETRPFIGRLARWLNTGIETTV